MTDQLQMFDQTTSKDSRKRISSPGPVAGLLRHGKPDGQTSAHSGPDHAPVSRFRSLDNEKAMPTNDTSGPLFTASSPSAGLQSSLESRLRERLGVNGSPECVLIWKTMDMPAGPPISVLRASARRIFGKGSIGAPWPTPEAGAFGAADPQAILDRRAKQAEKHGNNGFGLTLGQALSIWSTPRASDGEKGGPNMSFGAGGQPLPAQMAQATWATPTLKGDYNRKGLSESSGDGVATQMRGAIQNGSPAMTEKRGAPNPAFACWLMGWPDELSFGALRGIQSLCRSRLNSSAQ